MKSTIRLFVLIVCATLLATASTSCKNTAQGAGKDIENMGEKIQEKTK